MAVINGIKSAIMLIINLGPTVMRPNKLKKLSRPYILLKDHVM